MKFLKFLILVLIFWNIPSFLLVAGNATMGAASSLGIFGLILVYFLFSKKIKPSLSFLFLGASYFLISVIVDSQFAGGFIVIFIKYLIFIACSVSLVKDTTLKETYIILLLGSMSILFETFFLQVVGGRFSGFYLNPNSAGFICIIGYCLSFGIEKKTLKIVGQIIFSIAGIVTFSRTFLVLWVLINIISLLISYKNSYKLFLGIILFGFILSFGEELNFNTYRMNAFSSLLEGKINDNMEANSRDQTWAKYYDDIIQNPIFGNGYMSFSGRKIGSGEGAYIIDGVHNTPLMLLGEAGIIPLIIFLCIYSHLFYRGCRIFKLEPVFLLLTIALIMYLLTNHNYFDNYILLFISLIIYSEVNSNQLFEMKTLDNNSKNNKEII